MKNLINASCVGRPFLSHPISLHTPGNIQVSNPSPVTSAEGPFNEKWIYGDTGAETTFFCSVPIFRFLIDENSESNLLVELNFKMCG